MAINLATKYEKQFDQAFKESSYFNGRTSAKYNWDGAKAINVYAPITVDLVDYERNGSSRYGEATEIENTLQKMELTQDKSFTKTLDRGNYTDSQMAISAGAWMNEQINHGCTPAIEKYAIARWIQRAGTVNTIAAAPTKSTVTEAYADLDAALTNGNVPETGRTLYIPVTAHKWLKLSPEYMNIENLGEKALAKGVIGTFMGAEVVKLPDSYFPEDCYGLMVHKESVLNPKKISTYKTHNNPPGIDGWLMEGRLYFDAFVLANKCKGVAALVLAAKKLAAPAISAAGAITGADGEMYYTTDGSDPRYSATAVRAENATVGAAGDTIKAVNIGVDGSFTSDVTTTVRA
ncbi:MAG: hypothetical protein IJV67_02570 [Clostridia bacterium]|nr:hypothetical protein [Clostridia bacterium]